MPIAFEIQQGLPFVFTNLPDLVRNTTLRDLFLCNYTLVFMKEMSQCVRYLLHCIVSFVLINHPTLSEIDSASATDWEDV